LVYVSRNLRDVVPHDFDFEPDLAEQFLTRGLVIYSALEQNLVPDPIGSSHETCKYCLYKKHCKKDPCKEIQQPFVKEEKKTKPDTAFLL